MSYLESADFQRDFNNLVKALLLISKRLEEISLEIHQIREDLPELSKKPTTD